MPDHAHNTIDVTKDNFDQEVLQFPGVVLIDFWAVWCGPCRIMTPRIHGIADKYKDNPNVKVVEVNVDEDGGLSQEHSVLSIPTFKVFAKGELVDRPRIGITLAADLEALIEEGLKKIA